MRDEMPRKKKVKQEDQSEQIAEMIYKAIKFGNRDAKREIVAKLMLAGQIEFIKQIKYSIGEYEYSQVVEVC